MSILLPVADGILAEIQYDPDQDVLYGHVQLPEGGCCFSGTSLEQLREGFRITREALLDAVSDQR